MTDRPSPSDLTDLPPRMRNLPLDHAGRPVPKFVEWIDGKPDFRVMSSEHLQRAATFSLCWVCGHPLGVNVTFVSGPMCGVNRTSAEPPSHLDCARWSAQHCPFLNNPQKERRAGDLPEHAHMAGIGIMRNPGVALVWTTRRGWGPRRVPNGVLWYMGDPLDVRWYANGRPATRAEVDESIRTGLPALEALATSPLAKAELQRRLEALEPWLPQEVG